MFPRPVEAVSYTSWPSFSPKAERKKRERREKEGNRRKKTEKLSSWYESEREKFTTPQLAIAV